MFKSFQFNHALTGIAFFLVFPSLVFAAEYVEDAKKYPVQTARLIDIATNTNSNGVDFCQVTNSITNHSNEDQELVYATVNSLMLMGWKLKNVIVVNGVRYPGLVFNFTNGRKIIYGCAHDISEG